MANGKLICILLLLFAARAFPQTPDAAAVGARPLTLADAVARALDQASNYRAAKIGERLAAEDIKQARAGFYPKITVQPNLIYTSPSFSRPADAAPRPPSFLGANDVTEFQAFVNAAGEIDTSGKLKAALERSRAVLESARQGSEIARLELVQTVTDAYYNLALAAVKRRGAAENLQAAADFEANTRLQLDAGEVAPVDLVRARLQTAQRRDEAAQAATDETIAAAALRFLIGVDFNTPVVVEDLLVQLPQAGEIDAYVATAVSARPEFAQFEADRRASEEDVRLARAERRPQFNYSVSAGFISDSLRPNRIGNSTGVQATVGVTIPLFDWGASRSRETQARLRIEQTANSRILAERQFVEQFYVARTQALAAAARIRELGATIRDAEINLETSIARYRAGEAPIVEATDAQNLLIAARQALYQAIYDYQTARARLLRAIGQ
ncbi:MAG: TolC family protein [Acidobacteria bacterium]|nr:TolC family protein [Acidobacteriota bacterium]